MASVKWRKTLAALLESEGCESVKVEHTGQSHLKFTATHAGKNIVVIGSANQNGPRQLSNFHSDVRRAIRGTK